MYGSWTENVVLWRNFLGFIWGIKKHFNDELLLKLSAKSTFKFIHLGGYNIRIDFLKLLYNFDKKCKSNSTVNSN